MTSAERDAKIEEMHKLLSSNGKMGLCERVRRIETLIKLIGLVTIPVLIYIINQILARGLK